MSKTKSKSVKTSARRPWTSDDVKALKQMAKAREPAAKIAKTLKRTPGATRQKAFSEGISLNSMR